MLQATGLRAGGPDCNLSVLAASAQGWHVRGPSHHWLISILDSISMQGDLGGPRPRPGGDPEPDSGDEDVSPGQIIRWGSKGGKLLLLVSVGFLARTEQRRRGRVSRPNHQVRKAWVKLVLLVGLET